MTAAGLWKSENVLAGGQPLFRVAHSLWLWLCGPWLAGRKWRVVNSGIWKRR
jgi:hypothetical protein